MSGERAAFRGGGGRGGSSRGHGGDSGRGGGTRGGGTRGDSSGHHRGRGGGAQAQLQAGERPKKENILNLGKYMDKRITVKFSGGREGERLHSSLSSLRGGRTGGAEERNDTTRHDALSWQGPGRATGQRSRVFSASVAAACEGRLWLTIGVSPKTKQWSAR